MRNPANTGGGGAAGPRRGDDTGERQSGTVLHARESATSGRPRYANTASPTTSAIATRFEISVNRSLSVIEPIVTPPNPPPISRSIVAPANIAPTMNERTKAHTTRGGNDLR